MNKQEAQLSSLEIQIQQVQQTNDDQQAQMQGAKMQQAHDAQMQQIESNAAWIRQIQQMIDQVKLQQAMVAQEIQPIED